MATSAYHKHMHRITENNLDVVTSRKHACVLHLSHVSYGFLTDRGSSLTGHYITLVLSVSCFSTGSVPERYRLGVMISTDPEHCCGGVERGILTGQGLQGKSLSACPSRMSAHMWQCSASPASPSRKALRWLNELPILLRAVDGSGCCSYVKISI